MGETTIKKFKIPKKDHYEMDTNVNQNFFTITTQSTDTRSTILNVMLQVVLQISNCQITVSLLCFDINQQCFKLYFPYMDNLPLKVKTALYENFHYL